MDGHHSHRLSPCALGVAAGLTWSIGVFILALLAAHLELGKPMVDLLASLYAGYGPSIQGGLIGAAWGLLDGFITGFIFAWIYNCVLSVCCSLCRSKSS